MKTLFITITALLSFNTYSLPQYDPAELIIQSSLNDGYRIPPMTLFTNSTPSINDHREMAMSLNIINGTDRSGIWTKSRYSSGISYARLNSDFIDDIKINNDGHFAFLVKNQFQTLGLFKAMGHEYGYEIINLMEEFKLKNLSRFSTANLSHEGVITFKASDENANKGIYTLSDKLTQIDSENNQTQNEANSYIFTPATSHSGAIAYKARLGKERQWEESRPDQIISFVNGKRTIIAEDIDSNPQSKWKSFFNSVAINDHGDVAFIAKNLNGMHELVLYKNKQYYIYATEGQEIKSFTQFKPSLNNHGHIAFRASDLQGKPAIYISELGTVKKLLTAGDILDLEVGKRAVYYGKHVPFGGSLGLNNLGDVAVNVSLSDEKKKKDLGKGIIVLYTK